MAQKLPQKKLVTSDFVPPKLAMLMWIFIHAPGRPAMDKDKPNRKQASLYVDKNSDECKALTDEIDAFWNDNKTKGWKCKSKGYKVERVVKEGGDKDNEDDWIDGENMAFNFWTSANWKDGKDTVIDIYNARGSQVSLGNKKIGNGSFGSISGSMSIYDGGTATSRGVSLYLNAIQLTKFVEYSQDAGFAAQEDAEEDGFEGVESDFEGTSSEGDAEARPQL